MKLTRWLWPTLILLLVAGILIPVSPRFRPVPSDDPSVYLYVGNTLLHGGVPYRDAWDHKQPLAYLVYAVSLLISPHSLWGIWVIELLALAAAGLLALRLLGKVAPRPLSFLAVAVGLLTLYVIIWGYSLEELSLPLQVLALLAFAEIQTNPALKRRAIWGLAAGLATGAAFCFKQSLVPAGLAVGAYLLLEMLFCRSWRNWAPLTGMAGGFAIIAAPLGIYLWRAGALADYWAAVFGFNLAYAGLGPLERVKALFDALEFLAGTPGLFLSFALWLTCAMLYLLQSGPALSDLLRARLFHPLVIAAGAGLVILSLAAELVGSEPGFGLVQWLAILGGVALLAVGLLASLIGLRERVIGWLSAAPILPAQAGRQQTPQRPLTPRLITPLLGLAALYFPALLFTLTLSGRNYTYYFIPLVPFLMLAFGLVGAVLLAAQTQPREQSRAPRRVTAALLLGLGLALAYNPLLLIASGYRQPANPPLSKIADYVAANTTPQETILVWGKDMTYAYFITGRQAPTRYFYQAPVSLESYNAAHGVSAEILRDLEAHPPRLFMIYKDALTQTSPAKGTCPLEVSDQPNTPGQIFKSICARYQYQTTIDEFAVFRLGK